MAALEKDSLESPIKNPSLWWRYIDDIFMIWQHRKDKLKIFLEKLNSFHPSIKFTCEAFREKVIILMYTLLLIADLYVKQTGSH